MLFISIKVSFIDPYGTYCSENCKRANLSVFKQDYLVCLREFVLRRRMFAYTKSQSWVASVIDV